MQNELDMLAGLGITWPSPAYLVGVLLFSIVGMVAFYAGRRAGRPTSKWIGLALMLYPYVVWQTWAIYVVGALLCGGLWVDHRRMS